MHKPANHLLNRYTLLDPFYVIFAAGCYGAFVPSNRPDERVLLYAVGLLLFGLPTFWSVSVAEAWQIKSPFKRIGLHIYGAIAFWSVFPAIFMVIAFPFALVTFQDKLPFFLAFFIVVPFGGSIFIVEHKRQKRVAAQRTEPAHMSPQAHVPEQEANS